MQKQNNYIDEVKKIFETMQEDVANSHHLSDSYLEDLDNVIKQKLQETEQRKVEEIREEIEKTKKDISQTFNIIKETENTLEWYKKAGHNLAIKDILNLKSLQIK